MSFHILADGIRTINSFRRRTVVTTRLGAGRDGSLTVVKPRRNSIVRMEVRHRTIDADDDPSDRERVETEDSDVAVPDRTLNGAPYAAGTSSHIVHVIDDVMVPVAAGPALRLVRWNNIAVSAHGCLHMDMKQFSAAGCFAGDMRCGAFPPLA